MKKITPISMKAAKIKWGNSYKYMSHYILWAIIISPYKHFWTAMHYELPESRPMPHNDSQFHFLLLLGLHHTVRDWRFFSVLGPSKSGHCIANKVIELKFESTHCCLDIRFSSPSFSPLPLLLLHYYYYCYFNLLHQQQL